MIDLSEGKILRRLRLSDDSVFNEQRALGTEIPVRAARRKGKHRMGRVRRAERSSRSGLTGAAYGKLRKMSRK